MNNFSHMTTKKLRSLIKEIKCGGMGMKDVFIIRLIEDELNKRMRGLA